MNDAPLAGLLVAELGSRIGASVCGALLAQLGASVIYVEPAERIGKARHRAQLAAGKLSFAPNGDTALLHQLLDRADVVVSSTDCDGPNRPSRPAQILCDITAFGASGPRAGDAASDAEIQALSGVMDTTGLADGPPVPITLPISEYMAGGYGAAAVLAALRVRRRSGAGQAIDIAMFDCAFAAMTSFLPFVLVDRKAEVRRIGNRHALAVPWNVYRASDGWVLLCAGSNPQWQRLCGAMGRPELADAPGFAAMADRVAGASEVDAVVQAWIGAQTVARAVERLSEADIACGPIAPIEDFPREANLDHRGMIQRLRDPVLLREIFVPASPLRLSRTPGLAPARIPAPDEDRTKVRALAETTPPVAAAARAAPQLPLAGLRAIEIGHYTTAPLSARHLANLGADVIKIEQPEGEATRMWAPVRAGQGLFFGYTNADKRSLTLDLRGEAGAEALRRLIERSDILIENLKPGALAKRGFSWDAMQRLNPRLIYCAVSGFGAESLYAGRPAFDTVVQAMSGVMDSIRYDGVPLKTGISSADIIGAEVALVAVLAALEERERSGRGQFIDLSMQDASAWMTQTLWNDAPASSPAVLACADGCVVADAAFGDTGSLSRDEAVVAAKAAGVAASPVLGLREAVEFSQTEARRLWFEVDVDGTPYPLLASPMRLAATPPTVTRPMAPLGRDNDAILREIGLMGDR